MTMGTDTITGEPIYGACVDCVMALANGVSAATESAEPEWLDRFTQYMVSLPHWGYVTLTGEHLGFSMNRCDVCHSRLGGERYRIAIEAPNESETNDH